jgi:hypothetical protein
MILTEGMKMYNPMFLSWCKSFEQEVQEFRELIAGNPADVKLLRKELKELLSRGK